jgi:hypothetical protein
VASHEEELGGAFAFPLLYIACFPPKPLHAVSFTFTSSPSYRVTYHCTFCQLLEVVLRMNTFKFVSLSLLFILFHLPNSSQVILSPEALSISALVTDDRDCVRDCVDELAVQVECNANSCLCRTDVVPSAMYRISSCVSWFDCGAPDIAVGTSRYNAYCAAYTAELAGVPASVPATTTAAGTGASFTTGAPTFLFLPYRS